MLGNSRNILKNPENSVAAPLPTAPANHSCSMDASGLDSRIGDTNSQERGEGNAFASRSNAFDFHFAHRALCAAAILLRALADNARLGLRVFLAVTLLTSFPIT